MKKKKRPLFGILVLLFGAFLMFTAVRNLTDEFYPLVAPKGKIQIEKAETFEQREKGLSNREKLDSKKGMLFIFETDKAGCFWMKDTKFPLDIIWIDSDKKVVELEKDVRPETYPTAFCPTAKATYVLEIASGQSTVLGIDVGSQLRW